MFKEAAILQVTFVAVFCSESSEYRQLKSHQVAFTYILDKIQNSTITLCYISCHIHPQCFEAAFDPEIISSSNDVNCYLLKDYRDEIQENSGEETVDLLVLKDQCGGCKPGHTCNNNTQTCDCVDSSKCSCAAGVVGDSCQIDASFSVHFKVQSINVPAVTKLITTVSNMTVTFWIKIPTTITTTSGVHFFTIFYTPVKKQCNGFLMDLNNNDNMLRIHMHPYYYRTNFKLSTENWFHVSLTYNGDQNQVQMFINGTNVYSTTSSNVVPVTAEKIHVVLGNDADPVNGACVVDDIEQGITGMITQFYVWSRILSEEEIIKAYKNKPSLSDVFISWNEFRSVLHGSDVVENDYPFH